MPDLETMLVLGSINALLAWSMWLPIATGQISFGTAGAAAVGGYTVAWLNLNTALGITSRLIIGALAGAVFLLFAGVIGLRVKGFALGVVTLGMSESVRIVIGLIPDLGGPAGLAGLELMDDVPVVAFSAAVAALLLSWLVYRGRLGREADAIDTGEIQALALGIRVREVQVGAFCLSGVAAGLAGGLTVGYSGFVDPSIFGLQLNVAAFSAVVVGGMSIFAGPFVGALVLTAILESDLFVGETDIVVGVVLIVAVLIRRQGLVSRSTRLQRMRVRRKTSAIGGLGRTQEEP